MISMIALIISLIALAVCFLTFLFTQ